MLFCLFHFSFLFCFLFLKPNDLMYVIRIQKKLIGMMGTIFLVFLTEHALEELYFILPTFCKSHSSGYSSHSCDFIFPLHCCL